MKQALAAIFLFSTVSFARPTRAIPLWAELVAESHCEYLAMGIDWDRALRQAFLDRMHWRAEMTAAGDIAGKIVAVAITRRCNTLNYSAFVNRPQSTTAPSTTKVYEL